MIATKKYKNGFEIYIKFCFRTMYFYKKVEIDIFFKYSDFGQGESTLTNNQARENLPQYIQETKLLIGKSVQHHLKDECETWWCKGKVIGIEKPNKNNPKRTQYTVIYDCNESSFESLNCLKLINLPKNEIHSFFTVTFHICDPNYQKGAILTHPYRIWHFLIHSF